MNTANLQLEGLIMAMAGINQTLVAKGVLTNEEIDRFLTVMLQTILGDERVVEELSPSNRDAIAFPVRLLRLANNMAGDGDCPPFSDWREWCARASRLTTTSPRSQADLQLQRRSLCRRHRPAPHNSPGRSASPER